MTKSSTKFRKRVELAGCCSSAEVEVRAHQIVTFDNKKWSNLGDGRFVLIETVDKRYSKIKTVSQLFKQIKTVMSNGQLIAKYDPNLKYLRFVKYPKKVSGQASIHTVRN